MTRTKSPRCLATMRATSSRPATPEALSSAPLCTALTPGSSALDAPPIPRWSRCAPTTIAPGWRAAAPARITPITLLVSVRVGSSAIASRARCLPLASCAAALRVTTTAGIAVVDDHDADRALAARRERLVAQVAQARGRRAVELGRRRHEAMDEGDLA